MKLKIDKLQVSELVDTGSFIDTQDPCLKIKIGKSEFITERKVDAKCEADFPESYTIELSEDEYNSIEITVEVVNFNNSTMSKKSIHIGTGKVFLRSVVPKLNESSAVVIDLVHMGGGKKGDVKKGKVKLVAFIEHTPAVASIQTSKSITVSPMLASPAQSAVAAVTASEADPAPRPVERQIETVSDAVKHVDPKPTPTVAASDNGLKQDAVGGPASDVTKSRVQPSKPVDQRPLSVTTASGDHIADGSTLRLTLCGLLARDLKDTGSFLDPQDPALRLTVQGVEQITARIKDAKTNASFPEVFIFDIPVEAYNNGLEMEVEALNVSSSGSKTHIGIGRTVLKTAVPRVGVPSTFSVQLVHQKKKQSDEQKGTVEIAGTLEVAKPVKTTPVAVIKSKEPIQPKLGPAVDKPTTSSEAKPRVDATSEKAIDKPDLTALSGEKPTRLRVTLDQLHATELVDTGSFLDAQDPAVRITLGATEHMTARQQDAKTEARFPEVMVFDVEASDYEQGLEILVEVLNVSVSGSKTPIGVGKVLLRAALPHLGAESLFSVPLTHKKKAIDKGRLSLRGRVDALSVDAKSPSVVIVAPASKKEENTVVVTQPATAGVDGNVCLRVIRVEAQRMRAAEMMGGKNDLYVKLECALQGAVRFALKTAVKNEAGSDAVWEYAPGDRSAQFEMTAKEWNAGALLRAVVMDENKILSHTTIGSGEAPLPIPVAGEFEVRIPVSDDKHKASGEVVVRIAHEIIGSNVAPMVPVKLKVNPEVPKTSATHPSKAFNFTAGKLLVKRVVCMDLHNVEMLGGQNDPYVVLQHGAEVRQTECVEGGGTNVSFDFLDVCFEVDREALEFDPLLVKVFDRNSMQAHVLIGEASQSLAEALSRDSSTAPIEVTVTLSDKKGKPRGKVVLFVQLQSALVLSADQKEAPLDPQLAESGGALFIHRVRAFDLKNTHAMMGNAVNSPIVKLSFESFSHTTPPLDLTRTGGQTVFDHLDLEIPVSARNLISSLMTIEVLNHGMMGNTSVGKGSVAVKPAGHKTGTEVELRVDLADGGKTTGRVVIFASTERAVAKPVAADMPIQEGFSAGYFHIRSVTCHNLKNTEMFGGKQDPYVQFQFGPGWKERTTTQSGAGKEVHWTDLGLKGDVSRAQLMDPAAQMLTATAFDDNNVTADALIGMGTVSLRPAGAAVGKEVKLVVALLDTKGKPAGSLSLQVVMLEAITEEKLVVPAGFVQGCFRVRKIVAHGVLTGNMVSAPVPSVSLTFGEWSSRTSAGAGNDPSWDLLDIASPTFPAQQLISGPLLIELFDGKTLSASGVVENLRRPTAQPNQELELDVKLISVKNAVKKVPVGRVTLFLTVADPPVEKPAEVVVERQPAFVDGVLLVTYIKVYDLKNVELVGRSDPFVALSLGSWSAETRPLDNAGREVVFNNLSISADVTSQQLIAEEMDVKVWDKNSITSNALIGSARVSLKRLAYSLGKEIELAVTITDKSNRPAGKLVIRTEIRERDKASISKALPAGFTSGLVHITKMQTFSLKNTEFFGKQDPFVVVKMGGQIVDRTATKNNAGSDVLFDLLDIQAEVSATDLQTQSLSIEVFDDNTTGHRLIGTGSTSMTELYQFNKEVQLSVQIKSARGDSTGRVLLFARLEECPLAEEDVSKIAVTKDFLRGRILVQKIAAFKLYNTELITKQDPYVTLSMGDWSDTTSVQNNAVDNCSWDFLNIGVDADRATVESGIMSVVVKNKNLLGDVVIGSGSVSVRRVGVALNSLVELTVSLTNPKTKKAAGKIILHAELRNEEDDKNLKMQENFEFGTFKLSRIQAFNLKNTEVMGGLQDPFVVLSLGELWTGKTETKDDAGSSAEWNFLALECDVYRDTVADTPLQVVVFDENTTRANALIGKGTVSLLRCSSIIDKEFELTVALLDSKGKAAGKVVLFAQIASPQSDVPLPDSFQQGSLKIKRVTALGLKNSEMLGLSKGDPFVVLKLHDFSATTKALSNMGSNPTWNNLDYAVAVTARTIKVEELTVEAWDQNSISAHKLIGTCQLPLRKTGSKLESDVELSGILRDAKGKECGRVVVLTQLNAVAALSKPDLGLPRDFTVGTIVITSIKARGLTNKELLGGKQDPYVRVTVGDWSETTATLNNAGSSATWANLDLQAEVNADILTSEKIAVEVFDENATRGDCVLGAGFASVRKLCSRLNNSVDLTVDLSDSSGAKKGELTITAVLQTASLKDASDGLPVSAVVVNNGRLCVKQIKGFDLKGGDYGLNALGGKPDPYIMFELADWKCNSQTLNNAGRNPVWTDVSDVEREITGDVLRFKRLNVTVMDKNSFAKDAWMSRGDMSLRRLGSQPGVAVTHVIRLKDKRGKAAGKLEITGIVVPIESVPAGEGEPISTVDVPAKGRIALRQCEVSQLRNTAAITKQDLFLVLSIARFTKTTPVNKAAGIASRFPLKEQTNNMATAQLLKEGARVRVMSKGVAKDVLVGEATLSLTNVLQQPNTWVDVKSDVSFEAKFAGKCVLSAMFVPDGSEFDMDNFGDEDAPPSEQKESQNSGKGVDVAQLEERIRAQLEKERGELMAAMALQNANLTRSLEQLSVSISQERAAAKKKPQHDGTKIHEIGDLRLPADVKQWRSAHVQAWVAFQMELPQYMEAFQRASVDGLVLIRHITLDTLLNDLDVREPLHCSKLLEGIKGLQTRQKKIDEEVEKERLRRMQLQKEEEERKLKLLADLQKTAEKKTLPLKKKKKVKKVAAAMPGPKTWVGEVREQGVVDRARIERDMKNYRHDKLSKQQVADLKSSTWRFEYTGQPQPRVESLYDADPFAKSLGSKGYQNAMTLDILTSKSFTTSGTKKDESPKAPHFTKMRTVPASCSTEEVLAVVKGAMFDMSSWLLEVERIDFQRQAVLDSDLLDSQDARLHNLASRTLPGSFTPSARFNGIKVGGDLAVDESAQNSDKDDHNDGQDDDESVPGYDEMLDDAQVSRENDGGGDDDDDDNGGTLLPPAYDELSEWLEEPGQQQPPPPPRFKIAEMMAAELTSHQKPVFDRMTLVYNALVGQQNNNAKWLGSNDKLTRIKLSGGMESLLRLQCNWSQFDTLWTKLDYKRSGDIDLSEFKAFFGDLSEFERREGAQTLSTASSSKAVLALTKCVYELCDALRHAGFTVVEMFSGFDRNGSGEISLSEFCSMLRLVVGNGFDKRLIYQALSVLDSDGNKAISLSELLAFVYRIWKSQLDDLAARLASLDERMTGDAELIRKIVNERKVIKDAVKKNFPRQWRDKLEREGGANGHAIPGPFQALLRKMDIGNSGGAYSSDNAINTFDQSGPLDTTTRSLHPSSNNLNLGSPARTYRPSETASPGEHFPTVRIPSAPKPSARNHMSQSANSAGHNAIMRFRIKVPAGEVLTRIGAVLSTPAPNDLTRGLKVQSHETGHILRNDNTFGDMK